MRTRMMSVAGDFYPAAPDAVIETIHRFNHSLEETPENVWRCDMLVTYAVIVPHSQWRNSGFTANMAFRVLAGSPVDTIVVIGPSDHADFNGISALDTDLYQTPLGEIAVDKVLVQLLHEKFGVTTNPDLHHECGTEVQMPFIRHYFPDAKIVELVYGKIDPLSLEPIISYLLQYQKYAVVICTDLSHSHPLQKANDIDQICLNAVEQADTELLNEGCEACGKTGIEAMLLAAQAADMEGVLLDYRTSADVSGDTSSVIGYLSALFQDKL